MRKESKLYLGDCLEIMPQFETDSIDAIVTDPPYFLIDASGRGFMGNRWDSLYTSKINSILCKSKEFADFVERFFALMQIDSNTEEENTVQNDVNIKQYQKGVRKMSCVNAPSAEKNFNDSPHTLKVNINSVHGIVLTKAEVLDLLATNHIKNETLFKSLNEDALFAVPISYIEKSLKNIVAINALKLPTLNVCAEKEILLTSMEEARIKSVIEAKTGMRLERSVMPEMDINADTAGNTVEEKKYKHIILSHTKKEEVTNYLISLLYALFVMPELNKSRNSSFKDIVNRDLIYRFHKNWAVEALRVLKPGAFAFVMSSPRSDLLPLMTTALRDAGFDTNFTSMYWTYNTGFPKAQNLSKAADKHGGVSISWFGKWLKEWRTKNNISQKEIAKLFPSKTGGLTGCVANWELGLNMPTPTQFTKICRHFNLSFESIEEAKREVTGYGRNYSLHTTSYHPNQSNELEYEEKQKPATPQAKALDGAYGGFQPKPAVEVVIVAMKPLEEKTYVDQAISNKHGCTWLDDCRIPYLSERDKTFREKDVAYRIKNNISPTKSDINNGVGAFVNANSKGRFPANVLCEDDVLNDDNIRKSGNGIKNSIRDNYSSNTF
jgi:DNA modification methylase/transcriptional regulator with XRE-family HTH domain